MKGEKRFLLRVNDHPDVLAIRKNMIERARSDKERLAWLEKQRDSLLRASKEDAKKEWKEMVRVLKSKNLIRETYSPDFCSGTNIVVEGIDSDEVMFEVDVAENKSMSSILSELLRDL